MMAMIALVLMGTVANAQDPGPYTHSNQFAHRVD